MDEKGKEKNRVLTPMEQLATAIRTAAKEIEFRTLGDVSRIFRGKGVGSASLSTVHEGVHSRQTPSKEPGRARPFVRAGDIRGRTVKPPSDFVSGSTITKMSLDSFLRTGDLILSTIRTKGKVGVVPEKLDGAVPSKNVCVVRAKKLLPAYLRAILVSEPYETWIEENARGPGIGHLSIRSLRDLPIPVPPTELQIRLSKELPERATTHELQTAFLSDQEPDELTSFLLGASILSQLALAPTTTDMPLDASDIIPRLHEELLPSEKSFGKREITPHPVAGWLQHFCEMTSDFNDALNLAAGAERMALLSDLKEQMERLLGLVPGAGHRLEDRIRRASIAFKGLLDYEAETLLGLSRLVGRVEPSMIEAAKPVDVTFTLHNQGALAVRRISARTNPIESHHELSVLQSGEDVSWSVRIPAQTSGKMAIMLSWKAIRFDREPLQGEIPLAIEVAARGAAAERKLLGASPYVVGRPVDTVKDFYGRQHVIADIKRQLGGNGPGNIILFEGIRRSGKTSVLKYMMKQKLLEGWLPAYYSFQSGEGDTGKEGISTREIYLGISREVCLASLRAGYTVEVMEGEEQAGSTIKIMRALDRALDSYYDDVRPFRSFEMLMLSVLKRIYPVRLLLMLDEFDKLQVSIDNGLASPQVPENLRSLLHAYADINAILTGSKRLKHLRNEYMSVLFGLGYAIRLDPLDDSDAKRLIEEPVASELTFVTAATNRIIAWCAGQPFLIQSLCNRIFEHCVRSDDRIVTVDIVEAAAAEMVRDNEHFRTLWDHIGSEKRRFILLTIRQLTDEAARITHDLIASKLEQSGVVPDGGEPLGDSLAYLQELELVGYCGSVRSGVYSLAIPLTQLWLDKHIDFEEYRQRAQRELER